MSSNDMGTNLVPSEVKDKIITIGLKVNNVDNFNNFLLNLLNDEKFKEAMGAECVHIDFKSPISYEILENFSNSFNETIQECNRNINNLNMLYNFISAIASDTLINGPNETEAPVPIENDIKEE